MDSAQYKIHRPSWGEVVGVFLNVQAFANTDYKKAYRSAKTDKELDQHVLVKQNEKEVQLYTGLKYQCVEYARRFMVINQDCFFEDVWVASQIFNLSKVFSANNPKIELPFLSIKNGSENPPQKGDLIIWKKSLSQPFGHVAVVSDVNVKENYTDIVEQNYEHHYWPSQKYSRRLIMEQKNKKYYLTNKRVGKEYKKKGFFASIISDDSGDEEVIGWKRVDKPLKYLAN